MRELRDGRARFAQHLLVALASLAWSGCADESRPRSIDGTARTADTLARIAARERADPRGNPFRNAERAASIARDLASRGEGFDPEGHFYLAHELLSAGQTREAIAEAEGLIRATRSSLSAITPGSKPLFDLLGIAYLRLGEQENCLTDPAANMCILPLKGAARHTKEEGARRAIEVYDALLARFPDDHGSQWLLNVAHLAIGGYPDRVPGRFLVPRLLPDPSRRFPLFNNIAAMVGLADHGLSGGLSVDDFNGDGHLDLFMTSWGLDDPVRLFLADGQGGYAEGTAAAGLAGIVGGLNAVHADYDNDGDVDILVLRGAWLGDAGAHPNSLLRNRGDGTFEDVTFAAGLGSFHPTPTAAWADFNLDGFLDLFVGNESGVSTGAASHRSELFLNNGNGTFTEVSRRVGIDLDAFVKGVTWGDINNDGLPDLFASVLFGPNKLFVNRGGTSLADWRFEERAGPAGVEKPLASFTSWFWDFDQDGWDDLLVLSYDIRDSHALHAAVAREYRRQRQPGTDGTSPYGVESSRLYRNNRDGTFSDVTRRAGLEDKVIFAMGANFGDLDNDGWLDFYVGTGNPDLRSIIPNRMFRNVGGARFEEVTLEGGFGHLQKGHGTAFVDLDRDGDSDVYMVMGGAYQGDRFFNVLFENPGWPDRQWLTLELVGGASNRSAIGARVAVEVIGADGARRTVRRTIGTGGSFGAGSLALTVGLDRAVRIERVRVTWPDQARSATTYDGLALRSAYRIEQGAAPVKLDRPTIPFRKTGTAAHAKHEGAR